MCGMGPGTSAQHERAKTWKWTLTYGWRLVCSSSPFRLGPSHENQHQYTRMLCPSTSTKGGRW
eukprot:3004600-Amphidinium_carterae.1